MLKIRLTRTGKKNQASFRIVVAEHKRAVKSKFIEILGHYNPCLNPKKIEIKAERIKHWLEKGALPSKTMAALLRQEKILPPLDKEEFLKLQKKRPKRKDKKEEKTEKGGKNEKKDDKPDDKSKEKDSKKTDNNKKPEEKGEGKEDKGTKREDKKEDKPKKEKFEKKKPDEKDDRKNTKREGKEKR